jgi:hypothetical protein
MDTKTGNERRSGQDQFAASWQRVIEAERDMRRGWIETVSSATPPFALLLASHPRQRRRAWKLGLPRGICDASMDLIQLI